VKGDKGGESVSIRPTQSAYWGKTWQKRHGFEKQIAKKKTPYGREGENGEVLDRREGRTSGRILI